MNCVLGDFRERLYKVYAPIGIKSTVLNQRKSAPNRRKPQRCCVNVPYVSN
jgi:hypothetical protein